MTKSNLLIGRPGDLVWPGTQIDALACHIGAQPWYPAQCGLPEAERLQCGICGERLRHILHVPLTRLEDGSSGSPARQNALYLYACTKENCGREPGSWRALRCQWTTTESLLRPVESALPTQQPASQAPVGIGGWGLDTPGGSTEEDAFDFGDLCAALDAMSDATTSTGTAAVGKGSAKVSIRGTAGGAADIDKEPMITDQNGPTSLPGFFIEMVESDGSSRHQGGKQQKGMNKGSDAANREAAHLKELLETYDMEEGSGGSAVEELISSVTEGAASAASSGYNAVDGGERATWDGESYEKDEVLVVEGRKSVGKDFLKFMKRLQNVPDQCVRQGAEDGALLWPSAEDPTPGSCPRCGASRMFDVQLIAPTIAALEESADWLEAEGIEAAAVERPPASWDWATVAVFACQARCDPDQGMYAEEEVILAAED